MSAKWYHWLGLSGAGLAAAWAGIYAARKKRAVEEPTESLDELEDELEDELKDELARNAQKANEAAAQEEAAHHNRVVQFEAKMMSKEQGSPGGSGARIISNWSLDTQLIGEKLEPVTIKTKLPRYRIYWDKSWENLKYDQRAPSSAFSFGEKLGHCRGAWVLANTAGFPSFTEEPRVRIWTKRPPDTFADAPLVVDDRDEPQDWGLDPYSDPMNTGLVWHSESLLYSRRLTLRTGFKGTIGLRPGTYWIGYEIPVPDRVANYKNWGKFLRWYPKGPGNPKPSKMYSMIIRGNLTKHFKRLAWHVVYVPTRAKKVVVEPGKPVSVQLPRPVTWMWLAPDNTNYAELHTAPRDLYAILQTIHRAIEAVENVSGMPVKKVFEMFGKTFIDWFGGDKHSSVGGAMFARGIYHTLCAQRKEGYYTPYGEVSEVSYDDEEG